MMIDAKLIEIARDKFWRASVELNFKIMSPYCLDKSMELYAFVFMPDYGSINGAIVQLCELPDYSTNNEIFSWAQRHNCFHSSLNIEPLLKEYNQDYFIDILEDWEITK